MRQVDLENPGVAQQIFLTSRQKLFVSAILLIGPQRGCQAQAARMAGYRAAGKYTHGTIGYMLMKNPFVLRAIQEGLTIRASSPEKVRNKLVEISQSSFANFATITRKEDGTRDLEIDWEKCEAAAALGQIKEYRKDKNGAVTIKLHDPVKANEILAKMHGMLDDSMKVDGKLTVEVVYRHPNRIHADN